MKVRLPKVLVDTHSQILRDVKAKVGDAAALRRKRQAIEYCLKLIDPNWEPPLHIRRKNRPRVLPRGAITRDSLAMLRLHGALGLTDITNLVARKWGLPIDDTQGMERLSMAIITTLRNYVTRGIVQRLDVERTRKTARWAIRLQPANASTQRLNVVALRAR